MLPLLTRSEEGGSAGPPSSTVPPPRFRPLSSNIREVRMHTTPYNMAQGETPSQKNGLRYERQFHEYMIRHFPSYLPGANLHFLDDGVARTCQPDGILILDDLLFLLEVKYQHMPESWWQLEKLYRPLLKILLPTKSISCIEVCRTYDPSMPFPCPVKLIDNSSDWFSKAQKDFGVWVWRK